MTTFLYDDIYTGPRWTYGLKYRPISAYGKLPLAEDFIFFSDRTHPDFRTFGTVQYARELTAEDIESYQFTFIRQEPTNA